jgi:5-methylcytosine-specific restriction enzyme subunit McrC
MLSAEQADLLRLQYGALSPSNALGRANGLASVPQDMWVTSGGRRAAPALQPKVSLNNLFGMLEYAYNIGEFYDSTVPLESLQALYQRLAVMLARRVLERGRRGYYRAYIPQAERAAVVRGRLDVRRLLAAPWDPQPLCHYDEHTADIEDNRILGWTLYSIARSGLCQGAALAAVKQAYRAVGSLVTPEEIEAARCRGRLYHRQ